MRFKLVEKFDDTDISITLKETVGKLIIDEYEAINGYEQGIKFLEDNKYDEDIIKVLDDIMREENRHVGQLQEVLKMISPAAEEIAAGEQEGREQLGESLITEIYPNKGEDKKHFIARFMSATKDEYPDVKQRFAVANSYWDRKDKVNENFEIVKNDVEVFDTYNGLDTTIDLKLSNEDRDKLKDIGWSTTFKDSKGNDISDSDIIKTELYILDDMNYGTAIYININDDLDLIRVGETSEHLLKNHKVDFDAISRFVSNFFNRNKINEEFTTVKMDSKVKDWYKKDYADDELGDKINDDITFEDINKALDDKKDIYDFIGVHDSIVRERIFDKLAHIKQVDYDDIYHKWLSYDDLKESFSEDALIPLAEYLYDHLHISFDRRGNISYDEDDFYSYEAVKEYYDDRIDKRTYNKAVNLLKDGLKSAKFYQGDLHEPMLELSDRHLMWEITPQLTDDEYESFDRLYWEIADKQLEELEDKFGTEFGYGGRSGRHVVVENNVKNLIRFDDIKDAVDKAQDEFVSYMSNRENWKN